MQALPKQPRLRLLPGLLAGALLLACAGAERPADRLARIERLFDSARYLRDQAGITRSRGLDLSVHGVTLAELDSSAAALWRRVASAADSVPAVSLDSADRTALEVLRGRLAADPEAGSDAPSTTAAPVCRYDLAGLSREGLDSLTARVLACYGRAAERVVVDGDTLDRLTILGSLGRTDDRARRERLFRALGPVWRSVNGDDGARSPYRELVRLRLASWGDAGSPLERRVRRFGLEPDEAKRWLERGLAAWRATLPDTLVEPWDYYYVVGEASRRLSARLPRDSLLAVNHRFYAALGASPEELGIRYDLEPRAGKYPVAFTNFGARGLPQGAGWVRSEPWVFASYRVGGFDNLLELLHETGHAVHIAAIRARPAYHDWPDADLFTEGIADLAAQDAYEPAWQLEFLGDSASLEESIRAKYGSVMLDFAWSLFEIEVHRPGAPSPNAVWNAIVGRYLGIRPHPELSWWAMRGQLIESAGYMANYALGAFVVADLREETARRLAAGVGREAWYRIVSDGLFRHGLEVPARTVTERYLGRGPSIEALLRDLARIRRSERRRRGRGPR